MTQFSRGTDAASAPARHSSVLRASAAAALVVSILFASVGPALSASDSGSVRGPSSTLCRFFPIYCNPR